MHPLDQGTILQQAGADLFRGHTTEAYSNRMGYFGGYTAACLLRSVIYHPRRQDLPVALTVNYCAALASGAFDIRVREVRTGRSTQHWLAEMVQAGATVAIASVVCGARRPGWSHQPARPPAIVPWREVPVFEGMRFSGWFQRYDMHFVEGGPDFSPLPEGAHRAARSVLWLRDNPVRALDYVSLASMSDAFVIRGFIVRPKLVPAGTVTLTTYFHGDSDALVAQGDEPLLCVADAHAFSGGFGDQIAHMWGRDGRLLATSQQVVWYKE
jgi:acyl-CoA thioesterase